MTSREFQEYADRFLMSPEPPEALAARINAWKAQRERDELIAAGVTVSIVLLIAAGAYVYSRYKGAMRQRWQGFKRFMRRPFGISVTLTVERR